MARRIYPLFVFLFSFPSFKAMWFHCREFKLLDGLAGGMFLACMSFMGYVADENEIVVLKENNSAFAL